LEGGIATDATGLTSAGLASSLPSGLETPDGVLNLRKSGDSVAGTESARAPQLYTVLEQKAAGVGQVRRGAGGRGRSVLCSFCGLGPASVPVLITRSKSLAGRARGLGRGLGRAWARPWVVAGCVGGRRGPLLSGGGRLFAGEGPLHNPVA
jgi:hypothetical protein